MAPIRKQGRRSYTDLQIVVRGYSTAPATHQDRNQYARAFSDPADRKQKHGHTLPVV